jgi:hypothetical protein
VKLVEDVHAGLTLRSSARLVVFNGYFDTGHFVKDVFILETELRQGIFRTWLGRIAIPSIVPTPKGLQNS